jgi:hypothetical protein
LFVAGINLQQGLRYKEVFLSLLVYEGFFRWGFSSSSSSSVRE